MSSFMTEDMKMEMGNMELNPSELCSLHRGVVGCSELTILPGSEVPW